LAQARQTGLPVLTGGLTGLGLVAGTATLTGLTGGIRVQLEFFMSLNL